MHSKFDLHISILPELYDYTSHEQIVNTYFGNEEKKLKPLEKIKGLFFDSSKPREIFWLIANGGVYHSDDLYLRIVQYLTQYINLKILEIENRIAYENRVLFKSWNDYLLEKIFSPPYFMEYNETQIYQLVLNFPHQNEMLAMYNRITSKPIIEKDELLSSAIMDYWEQFEREFKLWYGIFEKDVLFIGKELAKEDGRQSYGSLKDVLQIKYSHESPSSRTPQGLNYDINSLIAELIHIRNAIAHNLYEFSDEDVELWDKNRRGIETYRSKKTVSDLYNLRFKLTLLHMGLINSAIHFSITKKITVFIAEKDPKNWKPIYCPICKKTSVHTILKGIKEVTCSYCGFIIKSN